MNEFEKDSICQWLLENLDINSHSKIPISAIEELGWKYSEFSSFAEHLQRDGFLSEVGVNKTVIYMILLPELRDFFLSGGFAEKRRVNELSNENLELKNLYLKAQLDILYKEAEGLKETYPATAERLIHIGASIATIFGITIQK